MDKIRNVINGSDSFALLLDENFEDHELLAREALRAALHYNKLNKEQPAETENKSSENEIVSSPKQKNTSICLIPHLPQIFSDKWTSILPEINTSNVFHTTSIHIPKTQLSIKEISYENSDDFFTLNIFSENNDLSPDKIVFEPGVPHVDAAFCFGLPNKEHLIHTTFEDKVALPSKEKIIFISSNTRTVSEKIYDIVEGLDSSILNQKNIASLLFASLLIETDNFTKHLREDVLSLGSILLEKGADKTTISEILQKEKSYSSAQILGRALARTRINEELKSIWTFISEQDLQKTKNSEPGAQFFYQLIQKIRNFVPSFSVSLVLWQKDKEVFCMIASTHESTDILESLAQKMKLPMQNKFVIAGPFANFSEAEIKLRNTLKEVF